MRDRKWIGGVAIAIGIGFIVWWTFMLIRELGSFEALHVPWQRLMIMKAAGCGFGAWAIISGLGLRQSKPWARGSLIGFFITLTLLGALWIFVAFVGFGTPLSDPRIFALVLTGYVLPLVWLLWRLVRKPK